RLSLNETLAIPENPPYLRKMDSFFRELEERSHITGCAVALEEIWRPYTGPSFDSERSNGFFALPIGRGVSVDRQQNGWYEIYTEEGTLSSLWIRAENATLTKPFTETGEPCMRAFPAEM